ESLQGSPVPGRGDPAGSALVPALPARVPARVRNSVRTRSVRRCQLRLAMGTGVCARTRQALPPRHLKTTNKSYRVDETYIKVKGKDRYLYRAVDSTGQTIDFLLTAKRDTEGAKRFFRKV